MLDRCKRMMGIPSDSSHPGTKGQGGTTKKPAPAKATHAAPQQGGHASKCVLYLSYSPWVFRSVYR